MSTKNTQLKMSSFGDIVVCSNTTRVQIDIDESRAYIYIPLNEKEKELLGVDCVNNAALRVEIIKGR